jgi:hypothetical protein
MTISPSECFCPACQAFDVALAAHERALREARSRELGSRPKIAATGRRLRRAGRRMDEAHGLGPSQKRPATPGGAQRA